MPTEVIVAIIAFIGTLAGSYFSNNKATAVTQEQIKAIKDDIKMLSTRVDKHNSVVERMAVAEEHIGHMEKEIDEIKKEEHN